MKPEHEKEISDLKYIPVGLGKEKFSKNFLTINSGKIYQKNSYYGEYTFHYWIWKNYTIRFKQTGLDFANIENFLLSNLSMRKTYFTAR